MANKFALAEAFTEFTIKGFTLFKSQMQQAKGLALAVAKPFLKLGGIIGKAFTPLRLGLGAVAGGAGIFGLLKLASTAEEVRNRFRLVFGDMADETEKFVVKLGAQFKRSTTEMRESLAAYQGYFIGLKIGNKTAAELSKTMLRLQLDFQSVADLSTTETQQKMLSTLAGMALPMRKYGFDIQEAAIQQELLAGGLDKTTAGASRQAKALAAMKIILDTMQRQKTIGDLPRTMGSMANQARSMLDMFRELGTTLGNFLTPIFKELAGLASAFAEVFRRSAEGALPKVEGILKSIGDIIRGIADRVRALDFGKWKEGVTDIWNSVIEGFGGAFLLIIQAAGDILVLAGVSAGEALVNAIEKSMGIDFSAIRLPSFLTGIKIGLPGSEGTKAERDARSLAQLSRIAKRLATRPGGFYQDIPEPPTLGENVAERIKQLGGSLAALAEEQKRKGTELFTDDFGNELTKAAKDQVQELKDAAKEGILRNDRLLAQLAQQGKKAAEVGPGAFAAIGFASLQKHMQNIISKGEEAAIALAKRAEQDRGKIIALLEDPTIQPAVVGP